MPCWGRKRGRCWWWSTRSADAQPELWRSGRGQAVSAALFTLFASRRLRRVGRRVKRSAAHVLIDGHPMLQRGKRALITIESFAEPACRSDRNGRIEIVEIAAI